MRKLLILFLLVALSLTACGGDDEEEVAQERPTSTPLPSPIPISTATPTVTPPPPPTSTATPAPVVEPPETSPLDAPTPHPVVLRDDSDTSPIAPAGNQVAILPETEQLITQAKSMLAEMPEVGVTLDQITLLNLEARDWPDGNLGCPQEGSDDALQAITPGYLIVLQANGQAYEFHTNATDQVVSCFDPAQ